MFMQTEDVALEHEPEDSSKKYANGTKNTARMDAFVTAFHMSAMSIQSSQNTMKSQLTNPKTGRRQERTAHETLVDEIK